MCFGISSPSKVSEFLNGAEREIGSGENLFQFRVTFDGDIASSWMNKKQSKWTVSKL